MSVIRKICIIINTFCPEAVELSTVFSAFLRERLPNSGSIIEFMFDGTPGQAPSGDFDAAVTLGGDGTVLFAARCCAPRNIPLFAVNLGQFGFLAAIQKTDWQLPLESFLRGELPLFSRLMLSVVVERRGKCVFDCSAVNDVVVSGTGIAKIVRLAVSLHDIPLGGYRADGIIVATPTGSTAYSAAAGGPMIDPALEAFVINPVCAFTLSNRPLVVPASEHVCIVVQQDQRTGIALTVDGQESFILEPSDRILVSKAPFYVILAGCSKEEFYTALRSKLAWSGGYELPKGGRS